ncbi:MAG: UPF0104 family protein [Mycobacteriaceae bacterium]|nr:UPF0104 family protein [Mycobacteriaceae bacterium]
MWWLKWVLGGLLVALLVGEGIVLWPHLHQSLQTLKNVQWGWMALAVWAEAISFSAFARIQKQLLHSGGVEVSQSKSLAVIYAANAMSVTLPAGPVFSTAFTYRCTRRWGATPLVASWQLAMSGVIAAAGLASLGFGGALIASGSVNHPFTLAFTLAVLIGLAWIGHYAARHPQQVERALRAVLRGVNRLRGKPDDDGMHKVKEIRDQLESVAIGKTDAVLTLVWTLGHRIGDVACLGFVCYAVGAHPSWAGLMIAFAVGKAVGTIPGAPSGLGYADAALVLALTGTAGMPAFQAVAAALLYRLISLVLAAIIGWIVFLFLFRRRRQAEDAELDAELDAERG